MNLKSILRHTLVLATVGVVAMAPLPGIGDPGSGRRLTFKGAEGLNLNGFLRDGPVAAHLLLRSGTDPRIVIAFPAGNSGVGLWFSHTALPVTWALLGQPQPLVVKDERGRPMYAMTAEAFVSGATEMLIKQTVMSSVRVLRDYQALGTFPPEVAANPTIQNSTITWARDRLDGAAGYRLIVEIVEGALRADGLTAGSEGRLKLKITAVSGEAPMAGIAGWDLLNTAAGADVTARTALTFLSYKEKYLAGSWRFNTYFGRDTLMSVRLRMPALAPEAVEAGLGAVLTRLSPQGEVAHQEDIGEFTILDHLRAG